MKRKFKIIPITASTTNGKYYLVDDKGNRYYADDKIDSFLDECARDFYMKEDIGYTAAESVDCLGEWAFNEAPKELGLSGVEHLYVPEELEVEYFDMAYTYACERGYDMYEHYRDW